MCRNQGPRVSKISRESNNPSEAICGKTNKKLKEDRGFTEAGDSINKNFASYLTGLIEGDGCIYTPKIDKNKNYVSPLITIAINAKDLPLITI